MLVIMLLGIHVGCLSLPLPAVTSPMASSGKDLKAKTFNAKDDIAMVYIYRDEFYAVEDWMDIIVDGKIIARSVVYSYAQLELSPGIHEIISRTERDVKLSLDVKAGQLYFIHQEGAPGLWRSRSKLVQVSAQVGQQGVKRCKLLADTSP